jgi:hypothetical protein
MENNPQVIPWLTVAAMVATSASCSIVFSTLWHYRIDPWLVARMPRWLRHSLGDPDTLTRVPSDELIGPQQPF